MWLKSAFSGVVVLLALLVLYPQPNLGKKLLFQSLTPKFAVLLGKTNVLKHADQTLFGNSYKYDFANLTSTRTRWPSIFITPLPWQRLAFGCRQND